MQKKLFLLFLSLYHLTIFSQNRIQGQVTNQGKQSLSLVQVILQKNSKLYKGAKTDTKGYFSIENIESGQYVIQYSFLGYKTIKKDLTINQDMVLANIILEDNTKQIEEVIVSARKNSKASNIDKKEYSPSQLLNSQNASAAELLNAIPSMSMGSEGNNLSFRGDENTAVMINGKMTSLTGDNLSQIPANSIEKIEVMSVPSSKYNSEGSAGIINIVLKNAKTNLNGGYVLGSIGNNNKYNAQIGYNWSSGKIALTGSYNYTYNEFENYGYSTRLFFDNPDNYRYQHNSFGEQTKRLHNVRIGAEYQISKRQTLSILGSFSRDWGSNFSTDDDTFISKSNQVFNQWNLSYQEKNPNTLYDLNLSYGLLMPNEKDKLSIEISRSDNMNDRSQTYTRSFEIYEGQPSSTAPRYHVDVFQRRPITAFQMDYNMNLGESQSFETGLRAANRDFSFNNIYKDITAVGEVINPRWSNYFRFEENVYSLYGLLSSSWSEKWVSKIGLRLEQTNTQSYNNDSSLITYQYFNAFPSALLRHNMGKAGNISASFSIRINRPSPGMLNPLQDVTDPISKRFGNPKLQPELVQSYELAYGNDFGKAISFSSSAYYKFSNNTITRYLAPNADGTFFVTVDNIGLTRFIGWEAIGSLKINKSTSLNLSSNLSHVNLEYSSPTGQLYQQQYVNWQGRGILNFKLPWDLESQLIAFYKSPFETPQGQIDFVSNVDFTIRKKILKGKGNIIAAVVDIFNDTKFQVENGDTGFSNIFNRKRETRFFTLTFRYNFGAEPSVKKSKVDKPENRDSGGEGGGM